MTEQEYDKRKLELQKEFEQKEFLLKKEYALQFAKYKVGDIISDGEFTIEVTLLQISSFMSRYPSINYIGYLLTKKGERRKDNQKHSINSDKAKLIH